MKPIYIIAEIGINHGGNVDSAIEMIHAAAQCGVSAAKFQSFTADTLVHRGLAAEQWAFFRGVELSIADHYRLAKTCLEAGIDFLSTPFDFAMVDLLVDINVPAIKIASGDLTNLPLIRYAARTGRPMFISTGMGNMAEVQAAVDAVMDVSDAEIVLMQCTSAYPTQYQDVHLSAIFAMAQHTGCSVGFSDHSVGSFVAFAAAAFGVGVIEKHFCLDKSAGGPDIECSADPIEMAELVYCCKVIRQAIGQPEKRMLDCERETAAVARRSIFYAADLPVGHVITDADLVYLRPAGGMSPADAADIVGSRLAADVQRLQAADPLDVLEVS